jgi:PD-(D/E)XK nuclease superfamily protein
MMAVETLEGRLKQFFASWQAPREGEPASTLSDRLSRFVEEFRPLSVSVLPELHPQGVTDNKLDIEHLETMLRDLHAPLVQARLAGALVNVWSAAGLKRDEVRNAAVLATLFDPHSYPETGPDFLCAFLQRTIHAGTSMLPNETELRAGYTVRTEDYSDEQLENRVDLTIESRDFLLVIEVKIDAREGTNQLSRYDHVLQAKAKLLGKRPALIYLSPRPPQLPPPEIVHATWADVVSAARQVGRAEPTAERSFVASLLLQFAAHASAFT